MPPAKMRQTRAHVRLFCVRCIAHLVLRQTRRDAKFALVRRHSVIARQWMNYSVTQHRIVERIIFHSRNRVLRVRGRALRDPHVKIRILIASQNRHLYLNHTLRPLWGVLNDSNRQSVHRTATAPVDTALSAETKAMTPPVPAHSQTLNL